MPRSSKNRNDSRSDQERISDAYRERSEKEAAPRELQTIPSAPEAERNMIALGLSDAAAATEIARAIKPTYCYELDQARIVKAMRDLVERGQTPDIISIDAELRAHNQPDIARELFTRVAEFNLLFIPDPVSSLELWAKEVYTTYKERTRIHLKYQLAQAGALGDLGKIEQLSAELRALDAPAVVEGEQEGEDWNAVAGIYFEQDGGIWMRREKEDGSTQPPLNMTNWTCRIVHETTLDDGSGQLDERYTLKAACLGRVVELELSREEFEGDGALARIQARLGARARINPKASARYLLDAIKALSGESVQERKLRSFTGWDNGRYLMGNGYVDADGWHESDRATLPGRLAERYQLQPGAHYPGAIGAFQSLLVAAPAPVMVPLLGAILLSPISHTMGAHPPLVHVYGITGTHKTALSCAAMALFGDFAPDKPTDTWSSSWKSVQVLGWHLAGTPMLLDDFKRKHVRPEDVTKLLQNYGDGTSRGTLTQDRRLNDTKPMRCVVISSGEDQPEGEASALARMINVELHRGDVNREMLADVQEHADELHQITCEYIAWIASQPALVEQNRQAHRETRNKALAGIEKLVGANATNPGRVASNVACLYVSWQTFCRFLVYRGVWNEREAANWLQTCHKTLSDLAKSQIDAVAGERYSELFLEALRGMLASGRYLLQRLDGEELEPKPGQIVIGGRDGKKGVYLITKVAYTEVCKVLVQAGQQPGFSEKALGQMLDEDGLLASKSDGNQTRCRKLAQDGGSPPRCWHLKPDVL